MCPRGAIRCMCPEGTTEDKSMPREGRNWSADKKRRWQEGWGKYLQVRRELEAQKPMFLDPRRPTRDERHAYSEWFGLCIRRWDAVLCSHQREEGNLELEKALHGVFARVDAARKTLEQVDKQGVSRFRKQQGKRATPIGHP